MSGEVNSVLGTATIDVPVGDEVYRLSYLRAADKQDFEVWLKARAWANLKADRPHYSDEDWQGQLSLHQLSGTSGQYTWGSGLCRQALANRPGRLYLLQIALGRHHPKIAADQVEELYDASQAEFDVAIERVLNPVPNSTSPAATAAAPGAEQASR